MLVIFEPNGQSGELNLQGRFDGSQDGSKIRDQLTLAARQKNFQFNRLGVESNIVRKSSAVIPGAFVGLREINETPSPLHSKSEIDARLPHVLATKNGIQSPHSFQYAKGNSRSELEA